MIFGLHSCMSKMLHVLQYCYTGDMQTKSMINQALKTIGEHGFSGVSVAGPTPVAALAHLLSIDDGAARRLVTELRRQSLSEVSQDSHGTSFRLTPKGIYRLQQSLITELKVPQPDKWDGHWRIIMFDVPTRHNRGRTQLTKQLKRMGFAMLRDSTWAYPYPCFEQLNQLVASCNLQQYVTYAEINKIDTTSGARLLRSFPNIKP